MTDFFITGTDTDIGKTVAAAWLQLHLNGNYWKPVQSGLDGDIDKNSVQSLTGFDDDHFLPSTYELTQPLSPHEAARRDNVEIDITQFEKPSSARPLIIEGAGGLMVPLNADYFVIDLIKQLSTPTILVCRSGLGTINHSLLSIEALQRRNIDLAGLIINGPLTPHNREALEEFGKIPIIAEIDHLTPLNKEALLAIKPEINLQTLEAAA